MNTFTSDNEFKIWNLATGTCIKSFVLDSCGEFYCWLKLSKKYQLVTGNHDRDNNTFSILLWDLDVLNPITKPEYNSIPLGNTTSIYCFLDSKSHITILLFD